MPQCCYKTHRKDSIFFKNRTFLIVPWEYETNIQSPNQELSGAKSELQGGTVGVCSSHERGGQPPYNLSFSPPSVYTTKS